jgi:hypothetical protein
MVLYNAAKRARYAEEITKQNQGGGSKKAGLPYQIGRDSWSSVFIHSVDPVNGRCCSLTQTMTMKFTPSNNLVRPVGGDVRIAAYRMF